MPTDPNLILPTTEQLLLELWNRMPEGRMPAKAWTRWFQESAAAAVVSRLPAFGCCGRGSGWDSEYLVDATVSENRADAQEADAFGYTRLVLAVETEWNTHAPEREYDFCKLADIRASLKLFACEVSRNVWKNVEDLVVQRFSQFWDQHEMVELGEEVGMMISCKDDVCAWVLRKGSIARPVHLRR